MTINLDFTYRERAEAAEARIKVLERALKQFANCNLSEENCADFDVANRRIRAIARGALKFSPVLTCSKGGRKER